MSLKFDPRKVEFPSQGTNRLLSDWIDFTDAEVEYRDAADRIKTDPAYLSNAKGFKMGACVR